jgi:hypothetical protein
MMAYKSVDQRCSVGSSGLASISRIIQRMYFSILNRRYSVILEVSFKSVIDFYMVCLLHLNGKVSWSPSFWSSSLALDVIVYLISGGYLVSVLTVLNVDRIDSIERTSEEVIRLQKLWKIS